MFRPEGEQRSWNGLNSSTRMLRPLGPTPESCSVHTSWGNLPPPATALAPAQPGVDWDAGLRGPAMALSSLAS